MSIVEGHPLLPHLASVVTPFLLATAIASRRRLFLRPEWQIWKIVPVHLAVGVGYAILSALGTTGLVTLSGGMDTIFPDQDPSVAVGAFTLYYFLIYAVLAGFMMWSESLHRVEESRALAARESVLRAEAEAKAVRAQFNPHFVFNTLHSLMLLVRADPKAAERAIEDVASLIRYASVLERRNQDVVSLGEEMEIARRYIGLESLRLSDRLRVEWDVEPGTEQMSVPPFSLQTLLENAIKHGISPKPEGGSITVRVARERNHLAIRVDDDGMGAEPSAVRKAEGNGLHLLESRIATMFGDAGSLDWTTSPGSGFSAVVRLPLDHERKAAPAETGSESDSDRGTS
jgi:LytS/YehU family sensor histidine kinase